MANLSCVLAPFIAFDCRMLESASLEKCEGITNGVQTGSNNLAPASADHFHATRRYLWISWPGHYNHPRTNTSKHVHTNPTINGVRRTVASTATQRHPSAIRKTTLHTQPRSATRPRRPNAQTQPQTTRQQIRKCRCRDHELCR